MRSPFDDLGKTRVENPQGEEVGGAFACQTPKCYSISREARFIRELELLTWECEDGHINKVEGFKIDG